MFCRQKLLSAIKSPPDGSTHTEKDVPPPARSPLRRCLGATEPIKQTMPVVKSSRLIGDIDEAADKDIFQNSKNNFRVGTSVPNLIT